MRPTTPLDRRSFLQTAAVAGAALAAGAKAFAQDASAPATASATPATPALPRPTYPTPIKLGFDNFTIRSLGLKAPALLDYGASIKVDSILISDLESYDNLTDAHLIDVRKKAADLGIQLHTGSWSICPTSRSFRNTWGTAEEHLALGIRVTKALGAPVFRVIQGSSNDRTSEGGIEARIQDTVKVLKALRSQAMDAGVKIAVENHSGDMQAWELVTLIESAGPEYVGACIDAGNAAITLENPLENLEILGKYIATSSLRDSMVWETPNGAGVQWTGIGEGNVDFRTYFKRFAELAPGATAHLELIGGTRMLNYNQDAFWNAYPKARARDFAKFVALAKTGKAPAVVARGGGGGRGAAGGAGAGAAAGAPAAGAAPGGGRGAGGGAGGAAAKAQLEASLAYCRDVLGLGVKA